MWAGNGDGHCRGVWTLLEFLLTTVDDDNGRSSDEHLCQSKKKIKIILYSEWENVSFSFIYNW